MVKRRSGIYTMKINVNNIFSESRDLYRDNLWTCLGAIYKVEIDQRWIVLKEVVTIIKNGDLIFFLTYFVLRDQCVILFRINVYTAGKC